MAIEKLNTRLKNKPEPMHKLDTIRAMNSD
jgi:hypothetical protein